MEHKSQPLAHNKLFYKRVFKQVFIAIGILLLSLLLGTLGYHFLAELGWIDSVYNAAMILGGMGPVNELHSDASKIFASVYAIYSGMVLIGLFGLIFTPIFHRILHKLHLEK